MFLGSKHVDKNTGSAARHVGPRPNYVTFLCLSFFSCKMGMISVPIDRVLRIKIRDLIFIKMLLHTRKLGT